MESLSLSPLWKSAPKNRTEPHGLLPIETIACDDWSGELKGPGTVPILVPGEIPWACVTDIFILKAEGPVSMQNDSILKILHISWKLHHFPCNTAPEYNPFPQYIKWTVSVSSINIQLSAYIAHVATFYRKMKCWHNASYHAWQAAGVKWTVDVWVETLSTEKLKGQPA